MHNMGSKACIKDEQNMNRCVPGRQSRMRYHETWLVSNEQDIIKRISRNKIDQTRKISKSIKQSINHEFTYVGPSPKPVYFARINSINLIT